MQLREGAFKAPRGWLCIGGEAEGAARFSKWLDLWHQLWFTGVDEWCEENCAILLLTFVCGCRVVFGFFCPVVGRWF